MQHGAGEKQTQDEGLGGGLNAPHYATQDTDEGKTHDKGVGMTGSWHQIQKGDVMCARFANAYFCT